MTDGSARSAFGTTQKCRSVRPESAMEGNPDIHWRRAEGPRSTRNVHRSLRVSGASVTSLRLMLLSISSGFGERFGDGSGGLN
jgi:hypothetical protein